VRRRLERLGSGYRRPRWVGRLAAIAIESIDTSGDVMPDHATRVYEGMLEMLSGEENPTPIVRLNRVVPLTQTRIYAKLEWYNPFGSVKDRVAHNLIRDADEKGLLSDGQQLVEPTSGNTGMGLAMMANARGYTLTTPLSKKIPAEKRVMLRMFGTKVEELDDDL
jgi:cysteine synthase